MTYVWVGIAGAVGALLRYGLGLFLQQPGSPAAFPFGTLAANLTGCFVLGWFSRRVLGNPRVSPRFRAAVSTGLIGSFTTYSAFGVETVELVRLGKWGSAALYIGISLVGGLLLVRMGSAAAGAGKERIRHG